MKMPMRMTMMILPAFLFACGGAGTAKISGKQGAAEAVHALTSATKGGGDRIAQPLYSSADANVACAKGGTAKLSGFTHSATLGSPIVVTSKYTLTLTNCGLATSDQGDAVYNGTAAVEQSVVLGSGDLKVAQKFTGNLTVGGAFNDTLALDVEESVNLSELGKQGSLSVVLKGTVITSTETHTFDGSVTVAGGTITVAGSKS